jgi:hypothetical protein
MASGTSKNMVLHGIVWVKMMNSLNAINGKKNSFVINLNSQINHLNYRFTSNGYFFQSAVRAGSIYIRVFDLNVILKIPKELFRISKGLSRLRMGF